MSASTLLPCLCLLTCFLKWSLTKDNGQITVKTGDDVTLQCLDQQGGNTELLEWTRMDLNDKVYLFYFKEKPLNEEYQHLDFKNRVELADPDMKNGNVSVILKKVNISDNGTYECYVGHGGKRQLITNITLNIRVPGDDEQETREEGNKDGGNNLKNVGLKVGLPVCIGLIGFVICFVLYKKQKGFKKNISYKATKTLRKLRYFQPEGLMFYQ